MIDVLLIRFYHCFISNPGLRCEVISQYDGGLLNKKLRLEHTWHYDGAGVNGRKKAFTAVFSKKRQEKYSFSRRTAEKKLFFLAFTSAPSYGIKYLS